MLPRIVYDDREDFPWLIVYGDGEVWIKCASRKGAESEVKRLYLLLETYGVLG